MAVALLTGPDARFGSAMLGATGVISVSGVPDLGLAGGKLESLKIDRQAAETRIVLNSVLDVRQTLVVHEALSSLLDDTVPLCIDGSQVTRIDTAAVQLIAAFCLFVRASARRVRWESASDEFRRAAALLNLEQELGMAA